MALLLEFIPLGLFFAAWVYQDIYLALIVLMIAMPIMLVIKYLQNRKLDKMYFWSTVLLLIGGTLTLYFRNPLFLYWKPTVLSWAVAIAFLASRFVAAQPLAKSYFGLMPDLNLEAVTEKQWNLLNYYWVLFFAGSGLLNIYIAYNFDEAVWVKFKVFGLLALTMIFVVAQTVWISTIISKAERQQAANHEP